MVLLKYLLYAIGWGSLLCAASAVLYDVWVSFALRGAFRRLFKSEQRPPQSPESPEPAYSAPLARAPFVRTRRNFRWSLAGKWFLAGVAALLLGASMVVVPDGYAGVRVSQISGVQPGTLYAGTHFVMPVVERIEVFEIRDRVFATMAEPIVGRGEEMLTIESREGLSIGLAVAVRYRLNPERLDYIQANLPRPVEDQIVEPVVTSAFRDLSPDYSVREIFSTKRDEFRQRAASVITSKLASDSIEVKEVMLRKVHLPQEYARGLEGLLEKEQQDDQTSVEVEIQKKMVKISESQAESAKVREVKRAEADAQSRVIMAKAESDAMQYTLPLKQKQIEQSRLEAQARKEATIQNAEADAQAKVIDSKAEQQRLNLLAEAEANRIRVTAQARARELELEAAALKSNPLLVQYTVAQKLSDKVQIMLVPSDGKFFFTNDVLRSAVAASSQGQSAGDPPANGGSGQ